MPVFRKTTRLPDDTQRTSEVTVQTARGRVTLSRPGELPAHVPSMDPERTARQIGRSLRRDRYRRA
jgi:hypothetical protein